MPGQLRMEIVVFKEIHQELLGDRLIFAADGYRTKQKTVMRILPNELANAFPQQHYRQEIALVFTADERTSQFNERIH